MDIIGNSKVFFWIIKERILAPINAINLKCYYKFKPTKIINYDDKINSECCIITVAFNDEIFIYYQNKLLKKYFRGEYNYIVFDNSNDALKSEKILNMCLKENISYIRLPDFKAKNVSYSHGVALNYIYRNYIGKRSYKYFVILDHDIFPISYFDYHDYLEKQPLYGLTRENEPNNILKKKIWYLWPGFSFFKTEYLKNKKIDFTPFFENGGDTGSSNYKSLFSELDFNNMSFAQQEWTDKKDGKTAWTTGYSVLDCGWIHMMNGSNYSKTDLTDFKMKYDRLVARLNKALQEND